MNFKSFLITELQEFNDLYNIIFEGTGKTLEELLKVIPSDRNRYFLKKRQEDGNSGSFLQFVDWNEKNDYIRLIYHVVPTYEKIIKIISSTKTGNEYISDHYECILELEDTKKFLGLKDEFLKLSSKEQEKLFRKYINETTLKVHSNSLDFYWQGTWENLDREGISVYHFPSMKPKGKQIWSIRHKNEKYALYLGKHILEVLGTLKFLVSKIVKMIRGDEFPPVPQKPIPVSIPPKPETKPGKKIRPIPSNQTVDLSTIPKVPAPTNVNIHQEVSARLMPAFNLVRNKKDWKLPIDKTIEADQKTIDDVEEAIQYFTGSPPEIKKIGKNLYKVKAAGYYESMGDFKV